jgi:hypothetical protein
VSCNSHDEVMRHLMAERTEENRKRLPELAQKDKFAPFSKPIPRFHEDYPVQWRYMKTCISCGSVIQPCCGH